MSLTPSPALSVPPGDPMSTVPQTGPGRSGRHAIIALLIVLGMWPGSLGEITRGLFYNAYVGVSVFVATTLLLVYGGERLLRTDLGRVLNRHKRLQIPIAALLGMSPGCAGAIVVTAAYSAGNVSLGALVAALTGTMGDAAFLLIATRPEAAAVVLPVSLVAGVVTGYLVDIAHKKHIPGRTDGGCGIGLRIGRVRWRDRVFLALALPGLGLGLLDAFQVTLQGAMATGAHLLALAGIGVVFMIWARSPVQAITSPEDSPLTRVAEETSFITIWVLGAYLAYGYVEAFSGLDLKMLFSTVAVALPLVGAVIGFIPGCGPQILVATLYVNGLVPFSALIANAISNDGDALFPAIALNPRAAVIATIYTTAPALVVGYGFYFLAPGFLN